MISSQSDHSPILLNIVVDTNHQPRPFRFFSAWFRDPTCKDVINEAWQTDIRGSKSYQLVQKSKLSKIALKQWNISSFGITHTRIKELTAQLDYLHSQPPTSNMLELQKSLESALDEQFIRDEEIWKQKSKEVWLHHGDTNSKFFHLSTIHR